MFKPHRCMVQAFSSYFLLHDLSFLGVPSSCVGHFDRPAMLANPLPPWSPPGTQQYARQPHLFSINTWGIYSDF